MAATLLEKLKEGLAATTPKTGMPGSETGAVQALVSAKTGMVGGGPKAVTKNLLEEAAKVQTTQQLGQVAEQAGMAATGVGQAFEQQAFKEEEAKRDIARAEEASRIQERIKTENILQGLEQGTKEISQREKEARMEQAGALLRLQTKMYTDRLRQEGEKNRLSDAVRFNEELARSIMAENQSLFDLELKGRKARDISDREFEKLLTQMSTADMINAARQNMSQAGKQAKISGMVGMGQTAVAGYGTYTSAQKGGEYDQGYQDYKSNLGEGERPMGYKAWQKKQKDIEATGPGMEA